MALTKENLEKRAALFDDSQALDKKQRREFKGEITELDERIAKQEKKIKEYKKSKSFLFEGQETKKQRLANLKFAEDGKFELLQTKLEFLKQEIKHYKSQVTLTEESASWRDDSKFRSGETIRQQRANKKNKKLVEFTRTYNEMKILKPEYQVSLDLGLEQEGVYQEKRSGLMAVSAYEYYDKKYHDASNTNIAKLKSNIADLDKLIKSEKDQKAKIELLQRKELCEEAILGQLIMQVTGAETYNKKVAFYGKLAIPRDKRDKAVDDSDSASTELLKAQAAAE